MLQSAAVLSAGLDVGKVGEYIRSFGIWAPLFSFALMVFQFIVAPLPAFVITFANAAVFGWVLGGALSWSSAMAGGLLFDFWKGSALIMIGALCNGMVGSRLAGIFDGRLRNRAPGLENLEREIRCNGFLVVFLLRFIPLLPCDLISYGAGFSGIGYRILATALGIVPGVLVYANIGANAFAVNSAGFYLSVGLLAALAGLSLILKKRL